MRQKSNVIMITLDGLRRDKLGLCENLSNITNDSLFFSNMVTASTYTFASMPAIFSGTYPSVNGIDSYYHMYRFKKELYKTLTQYLKDNGYYVVLDVLNDCVLPSQTVDETITHNMGDDLNAIHKDLIKNISDKKPFFLYLHYTSIHDEYKKLAKQFGDFDELYFGEEARIRNQEVYDSLVKKCDLYIKDIMDHVKSLGLEENTLVIFHSDHGTSNGEKLGDRLYGNSLYDYSLKTFFIVHSVSQKPLKVDFQVRTIDILPTILELLQIKKDNNFKDFQGVSLLNFTNDLENADRIAFSETGGLHGYWPSRDEHNIFSIRYREKKIIYNKTPDTWEFYDLKIDPEEASNLVDKNIPDFAYYKELMLQELNKNNIKVSHKNGKD